MIDGIAVRMRAIARLVAVALFGVALSACSSIEFKEPWEQGAGMYTVRPGDTLSGIAGRHGVSVAALARHNAIRDPDHIIVGQRIAIPGRDGTVQTAQASGGAAASPARSTPPPRASGQTAPSQPRPATPRQAADPGPGTGTPQFIWPVQGRVVSGYGGSANGQRNDGINIAASAGTPVKAAADGTVRYAGNEIRGFGNLVLVAHNGGYVTAYAHADQILVKRGDKVTRGQTIATVGKTGGVSEPQLHFEIRRNVAAVDPQRYLPRYTATRD